MAIAIQTGDFFKVTVTQFQTCLHQTFVLVLAEHNIVLNWHVLHEVSFALIYFFRMIFLVSFWGFDKVASVAPLFLFNFNFRIAHLTPLCELWLFFKNLQRGFSTFLCLTGSGHASWFCQQAGPYVSRHQGQWRSEWRIQGAAPKQQWRHCRFVLSHCYCWT